MLFRSRAQNHNLEPQHALSGSRNLEKYLEPQYALPKTGNPQKHLESRKLAKYHLKPPLAPEHALLGTPLKEIAEHPDTFVERYRHYTTLSARALEYTRAAGKLHHLEDVYYWWWHRVLDRLDRKESAHVAFDPHEQVIKSLQTIAAELRAEDQNVCGQTSYFADHMVPKCGFTVGQVEMARRDPLRWDRRNRRDEMTLEKDPSGELEVKMRECRIRTAGEKWQRYLRMLDIQRQSLYDPRRVRSMRANAMRAQFDTNTRVGRQAGWAGRARPQ